MTRTNTPRPAPGFAAARPVAVALALGLALAALPGCSLIITGDPDLCGNHELDEAEECDGPNFGDQDCTTFGHTGGNLVCTPWCRIETFNCHDYACGDGECYDAESPEWCPEDCTRGVECGDGHCDPSETVSGTAAYCPADCPGVVCGDGRCEPPGEHHTTCPKDCANALFCGDDVCSGFEQGEGEWQCQADCDNAPRCGNGQCEEGEDASSCPDDCSPCHLNSICEPELGETQANCADCSHCQDDNMCVPATEGDGASGVCPDCYALPGCGNNMCEQPEETILTCPDDCAQSCGDGIIDTGETCDGSNLGGAICAGRTARAGTYTFEGGDLVCNPQSCQLNTWECYPKDLGGACTGVDDCLPGAASDCVKRGGAGTGVCATSCPDGQGDCDAIDAGTYCTAVNVAGITPGQYCLRPCGGDPMDCPSGIPCIEALGGGGTTFCLPP